MEYVRLGKTGLQVSRIVLGCMGFGSPGWYPWVLDEQASAPILKRALDRGINFFDTSDIYSGGLSEEIVGRQVLKHVRRDDVVIATITHNHSGRRPNYLGISRKQMFDAIDRTLKRMGTDYVDLYQVPRYDWETTDEETMEALHDIVKTGRARYIGASSMLTYQFQRLQNTADRHGWTRFATMSNHLNLLYREEEREMNPYCREEGVGLIPWSPLARGLLAGNRDGGLGPTKRAKTDRQTSNFEYRPSDRRIVERVVKLAKKRGVKPVQIALAWLLHQPAVSAPIVGATTPEQIDDAADAVGLRLSAAEMRALEASYLPRPIAGFDPVGATVRLAEPNAVLREDQFAASPDAALKTPPAGPRR